MPARHRVEKRLNKLDGVAATVNFATEEARVRAASPVAVDELVAAVEAAGYHVHVPQPAPLEGEAVDPTTTTITTTASTTLGAA